MKTMMMRAALLALGLVAAGGAFARSDVRDGNAMVKPVSGDKYSVEGNTMGKAELYGLMGDMRDTDHITGIVLKRGGSDVNLEARMGWRSPTMIRRYAAANRLQRANDEHRRLAPGERV